MAELSKLATPKLLSSEEIVSGLLALPSLVETSVDEVDHVIIYGASGTGKTTLAGLLAEFFHILWFDGDKGMTALIHNLPVELVSRIHPIKIPDTPLNPIMVSTMLRAITGRQTEICLAHGIVSCPMCISNTAKKVTVAINTLPKNWVVIMDSQSQFVASALALSYYKVNPQMIGKESDEYWRGVKDEMFAYWGGARNVVEKFGSYVKDLRCQFIAISHELFITEGTGVNERVKSIVPIAGSEAASVNYARYYGTEIHAKLMNYQHKFISSTTYSLTEQAKSRSNIKLEEKKVPSLIHIFRPKEAEELLKGSYNEWFFSDRKLPQPKPKEILQP